MSFGRYCTAPQMPVLRSGGHVGCELVTKGVELTEPTFFFVLHEVCFPPHTLQEHSGMHSWVGFVVMLSRLGLEAVCLVLPIMQICK